MARVRRRCLKKGHKFSAAYPGAPYVFCSRFFCETSAVSIYAPPSVAADLHNAIPRDKRFPPVELNNDGSVKERFK
jgi:hypothetical protein